MWVAFALQKLLIFFSKKFQHICVWLDQNFNESLTNDIVSFEQLGPDCQSSTYSLAHQRRLSNCLTWSSRHAMRKCHEDMRPGKIQTSLPNYLIWLSKVLKVWIYEVWILHNTPVNKFYWVYTWPKILMCKFAYMQTDLHLATAN